MVKWKNTKRYTIERRNGRYSMKKGKKGKYGNGMRYTIEGRKREKGKKRDIL
jgi:hypothetical protein